MPNVRRYYIPNSIVFITQVTDNRAPIFASPETVELLRTTLRNVQSLHPFRMIGYVFLPDHLHLLIAPAEETTFSAIMHSLKRNITFEYRRCSPTASEANIWQRSFWDHIIRNDVDFERHLDYIHYNPVRHGYVDKPELWPDSSYLVWKNRGAYSDRWGWEMEPNNIRDAVWE